jgi:hypothetical protein
MSTQQLTIKLTLLSIYLIKHVLTCFNISFVVNYCIASHKIPLILLLLCVYLLPQECVY